MNTNIPQDPAMLLSFVNMKLRDEYRDLDELCDALDIDRPDLEHRLGEARFTYDPENNRFR